MLQFQGHGAPVTCLDEGNESDPIFFTGSADTRIMVWDARTAKLPMWIWEGHQGTVMSVRSFGTVAVSAGQDGSVCEWDVSTGRMKKKHQCPAPILAAESSGGRFVAATWAQRMHVFTFDNRRPSLVRSPLPFTPTMANGSANPSSSASARGGSISPSWSPTTALTNNDNNATSPWISPAITLSTPPLDPLLVPPPPSLSNRTYSPLEASPPQSQSPESLSDSPSLSRWEKMGGKPLTQLDSVTEGDEELPLPSRSKKTNGDASKVSALVRPVKTALGDDMDAETVKTAKGPDQKNAFSKIVDEVVATESVRVKPHLKSPSDEGRAKPKLRSAVRTNSDEGASSVTPNGESNPPRVIARRRSKVLEGGGHSPAVSPVDGKVGKFRRASIKKESKKDSEKKELMATLTKTRRSHTPPRSKGLAPTQRGKVAKEQQRVKKLDTTAEEVVNQTDDVHTPLVVSGGITRSKSPRLKRDGTHVVRSRSPRQPPPRSVNGVVNNTHTQDGSLTAVSPAPVDRGRSDSCSSDIAEMAGSLEAFLRGAKLGVHFDAMVEGGIENLEHLETAEDSTLVAIGFKKPEIKRLRRYLQKVIALCA